MLNTRPTTRCSGEDVSSVSQRSFVSAAPTLPNSKWQHFARWAGQIIAAGGAGNYTIRWPFHTFTESAKPSSGEFLSAAPNTGRRRNLRFLDRCRLFATRRGRLLPPNANHRLVTGERKRLRLFFALLQY